MKLIRLIAILMIFTGFYIKAEFLPNSYINGLIQRYPAFAQQIETINTEINLSWTNRNDENKNKTAQTIITKINRLKDILCNAVRTEIDETIKEISEWEFVSE